LSAAQSAIFDWLEKTVNKRDGLTRSDKPFDWKVANKYFNGSEMRELQKSIRISNGGDAIEPSIAST